MPQLVGMAAVVALLAANLFVFAFGFSWGPVMWVMLGEMFNNRIRAVAGPLRDGELDRELVHRPNLSPLLEASACTGLRALCHGGRAISFFLVLFFVRETSGKELEDMA